MVIPGFCKMGVVIFECDDESEPTSVLNLKPSIFLRFVFHLFIIIVPETLDLNAYTVTAIRGTDFDSSMKKAYNVIRRNPAKYMITNLVSFLF